MKNRFLTALVVVCLSLPAAGCFGGRSAGDVFWNVVDTVNDFINTLDAGSKYALGQIPAVCADIAAWDKQFRDSRISINYPQPIVTAEAKAMAAASVPCNNYPTTISQALAQFKPAYVAFRNAKADAETFANQLDAK